MTAFSLAALIFQPYLKVFNEPKPGTNPSYKIFLIYPADQNHILLYFVIFNTLDGWDRINIGGAFQSLPRLTSIRLLGVLATHWGDCLLPELIKQSWYCVQAFVGWCGYKEQR